MSDLETFIAALKPGPNQMLVGGGGRAAAGLVDGPAAIPLDDPETITAEAFNRGIFPVDTPWEEALTKVRNVISNETRAEVKRQTGKKA
jgi:hypothetical protein